MKEDAAEFERSWIDAWKYAAPELKRIRQDELKQLENAPATATSDSKQSEKKTEASGLEVFQQWMMRWRVLLLMEEVAKRES